MLPAPMKPILLPTLPEDCISADLRGLQNFDATAQRRL